MPSYRYLHLDVFTRRPLTGNQLAVFLEPQGLSADEMLAITREMAFSETTFVFPAETPDTAFRVRIFALNLNREIEVAGHPTIGTVFALAQAGLIASGQQQLTLGLGIGPTTVELDWVGEQLAFVWMQQRLPKFEGQLNDVAAVAAALNLTTADLQAPQLPIEQVSCGASFLMVPVVSRAAVDRALLDRAALGRLIDQAGLTRRGVFIFAVEQNAEAVNVYSRMLGFGVSEDPATGNANGPMGAYLVHHQVVSPELGAKIVSQQGVKMGRPSQIYVDVRSVARTITSVRVGGSAVHVGEGTVLVAR